MPARARSSARGSDRELGSKLIAAMFALTGALFVVFCFLARFAFLSGSIAIILALGIGVLCLGVARGLWMRRELWRKAAIVLLVIFILNDVQAFEESVIFSLTGIAIAALSIWHLTRRTTMAKFR